MDQIEPLAYRILEYIRRVNREQERGPSARELSSEFGLLGPGDVLPYLRQLALAKLIRVHPPGSGEQAEA